MTLSIDNKELIDYVMDKNTRRMTLNQFNGTQFGMGLCRGSQLRRGTIDNRFPVDYHVITSRSGHGDGGALLQRVDNSILSIRCSDGNIDFSARQQALHNLFKQWTYKTREGKIAKETLYDKYIQYGYEWDIFLVNGSIPFIRTGTAFNGSPTIGPIIDKTTGKIVILGGQNK